MAKKGKFDLAQLVQAGYVKDGDTIYFVSDPAKTGAISKQSNGEYRLNCGGEVVSVHAAAQRFLGQEPPNHASQWLRTNSGQTLYQLWQSQSSEE